MVVDAAIVLIALVLAFLFGTRFGPHPVLCIPAIELCMGGGRGRGRRGFRRRFRGRRFRRGVWRRMSCGGGASRGFKRYG